MVSIHHTLSRYTVIHGQCLSVGVGGYLLGGGVNALGASARHGFGAQQVIKMKVSVTWSQHDVMETIAGSAGRWAPGHSHRGQSQDPDSRPVAEHNGHPGH